MKPSDQETESYPVTPYQAVNATNGLNPTIVIFCSGMASIAISGKREIRQIIKACNFALDEQDYL
jgi:hypothetical protein